MTAAARCFKQPISVLVVIYTLQQEVLLLERAAFPGFWQSVTGSREGSETLRDTAVREVAEETGLDAQAHQLADWKITNRFRLFDQWRQRYAPGVTHNDEHVFGLALPHRLAITPSPQEHRDWRWFSLDEAIERCFSWSNRDALMLLKARFADSVTPSPLA